MAQNLVKNLLESRGIFGEDQAEFLTPDYDKNSHNPFLLPDMDKAVKRLESALANDHQVYIYGDYDIDGLTATTLLLDSFRSFGLRAKAFIPNRFVEGYGLSGDAVKKLAKEGAQLIVTVDCGSLSHKEIELANSLGVDVIVTDHHSVAKTMPPAVATINPKRKDHSYPFIDLAGVGVAFKLVQALQTKIDGLPKGQEKWLLDLVAFGTVCDVVTLLGENRANVFWGLEVLKKTRRPGLKALSSVVGLKMEELSSRSLGFVLGPHLNAAGRLETAQYSLDLLTETDPMKSLEIAYKLHEMNSERRVEQNRITKEAMLLAEQFSGPVVVVSDPTWSHGIIGIVAAKLLEAFKKPTFVLQEMVEESKGSARSYGDFSAVEAIRYSDQWIIKGGGHKLAAGVTLKTENISNFRNSVNDFYKKTGIIDQQKYLEPNADVVIDDISKLNSDLFKEIKQLEPFGNGNEEPIFKLADVAVTSRQNIGKESTHLKLVVTDKQKNRFSLIGFGFASKTNCIIGDRIDIWLKLIKNEWRGAVNIEGQIVKIQDK